MPLSLPLILDGLILVLLAGTMIFAARLSVQLQNFRNSRAALDKLVADLAQQIEQADRAVAGMRESARDGGRDLQQHINEARALCEELQFMNETGNNLAARLERLAESGARNRPQASFEPSFDERMAEIDGYEDSQPVRKSPAQKKALTKPAGGGFAIRDPDFEEDESVPEGEPAFGADEPGAEPALQSRAERELFAALKGRGKGGAG